MKQMFFIFVVLFLSLCASESNHKPRNPSLKPSKAISVVNREGRTDIFAVGSNGYMYTTNKTSSTSTTFSGWSAMYIYPKSSPSAVSWGPDRIDVFAIDLYSHLMTWNTSMTLYSTWVDISEGRSFLPIVSSYSLGLGILDIFVVDTDYKLWNKQYRSGAWSTFKQLTTIGFPTSAAVPISYLTSNRLYVFTSVDGGKINYNVRVGTGSWSAGALVPSDLPLLSTPSVAVSDGLLYVTSLSNDSSISYTTFDGFDWNPNFTTFQNKSASDLAAVSWGADRLDIFFTGFQSSEIRYTYLSGSSWTFSQTGNFGNSISSPTVISPSLGRYEIYYLQWNGYMYWGSYLYTTGWSFFGAIGNIVFRP